MSLATINDVLTRFALLSVKERPGAAQNHPAITWGHELCGLGTNIHDEVAWCSSILNLAAALVRRRRSRSAAARSWLNPALGTLTLDPGHFRSVLAMNASNTVLVFKRGAGRGQLGADVLDAPGHVASLHHYAVAAPDDVRVVGGNQSNMINIASLRVDDLLGVLMLGEDAL